MRCECTPCGHLKPRRDRALASPKTPPRPFAIPRSLRESERVLPQATCGPAGAVGSRPSNRAPTSPARLLRDSSPRASVVQGLLSRGGAVEQLQHARELEGLVDDRGGT